MAEIFSISAFKILRDRNRSRMDSDLWPENLKEAVIYSWIYFFRHHGFTQEEALQKANEQLTLLRKRTSQEG